MNQEELLKRWKIAEYILKKGLSAKDSKNRRKCFRAAAYIREECHAGGIDLSGYKQVVPKTKVLPAWYTSAVKGKRCDWCGGPKGVWRDNCNRPLAVKARILAGKEMEAKNLVDTAPLVCKTCVAHEWYDKEYSRKIEFNIDPEDKMNWLEESFKGWDKSRSLEENRAAKELFYIEQRKANE